MRFQHYGAPSHHDREWLPENYPGRWTARGREALDSWPPRSLDLNTVE
jgi:hypothetical protein